MGSASPGLVTTLISQTSKWGSIMTQWGGGLTI
jgi:hypothetical protein